MSGLKSRMRWIVHELGIEAIIATGRNAYLIILARTCRMFAFGANALILAIFFSEAKFSDNQIGLFMTLTLLGDVVLGTYITLIADRVGRRRVLLGGSVLMALSGVIFAVFENFWILLLAAIVGVLSVTGGDFGPFRSIEESIISELTTTSTRADVYSWYVVTSTIGMSTGNEASGRFIQYLQDHTDWTLLDSYHAIFWIYTIMGVVNGILVLLMTKECELGSRKDTDYSQVPQEEIGEHESPVEDSITVDNTGLEKSDTSRLAPIRKWFLNTVSQISAPTRAVMYKLWFLLAVDSLADGMAPISLTTYYMDEKFQPSKAALGDVTSASYMLGAMTSVFAGFLCRHLGLINTMVFTHVPSSAAVLLFPFPTAFWLASVFLMIRVGLNNMDQAPRSAFIAAVVRPEERTAVMGITSTLRTLASMAGPTLTGFLAAKDQFWIAFVAAGTFRLLYDFGLYALFVNMKIDPEEDKAKSDSTSHAQLHNDEERGLEMEHFSFEDSDADEPSLDQGEAQKQLKANLPIPSVPEAPRGRSPHRYTNSNG